MNRILVLCTALVASSSAQYLVSPYAIPGLLANPYNIAPQVVVRTVAAPQVVVSAPVAVPTSSQYHAQDELGQFAFGHSSASQAREEVKTLDGTVRGAYSYVDANGKLINVQYQADDQGFKVLGANNLPVAAEVTLEPVQDTPEVVAARADFAKKFEEAKEAAAKEPETKSRRRRQVILSSVIPALAKTTLKTQEFTPVSDAKTPAATKLTELKETEQQILTPLHVPTLLSNPIITSRFISPSVILKAAEDKPVQEKSEEEKKETLPVLTDAALFTSPLISSRILSPTPLISSRIITPSLLVGKTTIKTSELKPIEDAKTPAGTKLADIKETEKEIPTPIVYQAPTLVHSPFIGSGLISLF